MMGCFPIYLYLKKPELRMRSRFGLKEARLLLTRKLRPGFFGYKKASDIKGTLGKQTTR